jgi:hypothetical protein
MADAELKLGSIFSKYRMADAELKLSATLAL